MDMLDNIYIVMALTIITFLYNILIKKEFKLNIVLVLITIIITFILELGKLPFVANDETINGIYPGNISGISFILISLITIVFAIIMLFKIRKNMNFKKILKYIIEVIIIGMIFGYFVIVYGGIGGILITTYTTKEILNMRLNEYCKMLPVILLNINIFVFLINSYKENKKERINNKNEQKN